MNNQNSNQISPSKEDYLKVLYDLSKKNADIHSVDVARTMGVSLPSVSRAMNELKEGGYINKLKYGAIHITAKGMQTAGLLKQRNDLLERFLTQVLNVDILTAKTDACRMEHALSNETTGKLELYIESLIKCVRHV